MSGCPFHIVKNPLPPPSNPFENELIGSKANPLLLPPDRQYSRPYISPYFSSLFRYSNLSCPKFEDYLFIYQNSLFQQSLIISHRKDTLTKKLILANDLRESGNKHFSLGALEKAMVCYEHSFGLFAWLEIENKKTIDEEGLEEIEEVFLLKEPTELEKEDEVIRESTLASVLMNMVFCLIKLRHFEEADQLLKEIYRRIGKSPRFSLAKAYIKFLNKESDVQALNLGMIDLQEAIKAIPEAEILKEPFNCILKQAYQDECEFYSRFLKEVKNAVGRKLPENSEMEYTVIKNMVQRYHKMVAYYQQDLVQLSKVEQERESLQEIYSKMTWVLKLSPESSLLKQHIKQENIQALSGFEAVKRDEIQKIFNSGKYNQRLLYQSIKETMLQYESLKKHEEPLTTYKFSKHLFYFLALLAFCFFYHVFYQ